MRTLHLKRDRQRRILSGHRWAFAGEITEDLKQFEPGERVVLCESRGQILGRGYVNPHSLIAVRLVTVGEEPWDGGLIERRVEEAVRQREALYPEAEGVRLVYGESDGLPGLIVDRFGGHLVLQSLTAGMERMLDEVIAALRGRLQPESIFAKGGSPFRKLEGLEQEDRQILGATPAEIGFVEEGLKFRAHPIHGQKSGFYLDQRDNRVTGARLVKSGTVLDLYCYTGAWGLSLLNAGATEATMVDSSAAAINWGMEAAGDNGVTGRALFVEADVGEFLTAAAGAGRSWDAVIADPPAFVPNRQSLAKGSNAYIALNRAALRVVKPGGLLISCSCSHPMTRELHLEAIGRAAYQEGRRLRVIAAGGQAADHPILPGHPETEYLKCWFIEVV